MLKAGQTHSVSLTATVGREDEHAQREAAQAGIPPRRRRIALFVFLFEIHLLALSHISIRNMYKFFKVSENVHE